MMRDGAKLASYRVLAQALERVRALPWELEVVGDGPERAVVEALFAPFGADRVRLTGACDGTGVAARLRDADLFVWPAVDEAFGMAFLEAQASGLPVVAGKGPGVATVVVSGRTGYLAPMGDAEGFAAAVAKLVGDRALRMRMGRAAAAYVRRHHDIATAAAEIDALLRRLVLAGGGASPPARAARLPC